jgi:hypothetical protein
MDFDKNDLSIEIRLDDSYLDITLFYNKEKIDCDYIKIQDLADAIKSKLQK